MSQLMATIVLAVIAHCEALFTIWGTQPQSLFVVMLHVSSPLAKLVHGEPQWVGNACCAELC